MTRKPIPSVKEQLAALGLSERDVSFIGDVPVSRNKYGAESVDDPEDGYFASSLEHSTWVDLKRRRDEGEISELRRQVPFDFWIEGVWVGRYVADFVFIEDGVEVVADAKGKLLELYLIKSRLMWVCYGVRIREYSKDGILPLRKLKTR